MAFKVKFIENWNGSELKGYDSINSDTYFRGGYARIYTNINLHDVLSSGDQFVITNTVSNNDTYTYSGGSACSTYGYKYIIYVTAAVVEETIEATFSVPGGATFYPSQILKDSSILSDNIKFISKTNTFFDPQKYISEDFFMSQPREATLKFLKDDARWLEEKFADENLSEEINSVLFFDVDGNLLELAEGINPFDPVYNVGGTINQVEITEKQVLLQQISKIVVEVWNDDEKVYTGFVDKSQTDQDATTITIQCTDIIGIIDKFAEQLIKDMVIYSGNEDDYQYIISKDILDGLFEKIKNFTGLNFLDNNSNNFYNTNTSYLDESIIGLNIDATPFNVGLWLNGSKIIASSVLQSFVVYLKQPLIWQFNLEGITYQRYSMYYRTVSYEGIISEELSFGVILKKYENGEWDYLKSESEALNLFYTEIGASGSGYVIEDSTYGSVIVFLNENSSGTYDFYKIVEEYYGFAIPVYSDVYTYKDLLKTIFFVNTIAMNSTNSGNIELIKKDAISNVTDYDIDNADIMKKSWKVQNIEKDNDPSAEVLSIIWVDYEDDSIEWKKFYNYIKSIYAYIFTNKYPQTLNCNIYVTSNVDRSTINLVLGDTITTEHKKIVDGVVTIIYKKWVINEVPKNNTGFYYMVKALRIKDEE